MPTSGGGISDPIPGGGAGGAGVSVPREQPYTLLPLERFARIINYSPMLFHQIQVSDLQEPTSCSDPLLQYSWQPFGGGQPGRTEIAQAIQQAEDLIEQEGHFSVRPRWYADELVEPLTTPNRGASLWGGWTPRWLGVRAKGGYFISAGQEAWSLVQANAPITHSDRDGDGYSEWASVTVNTTVTDPNEIAVYYPGTSHDPGWEIRPLIVTISGGVATIRFSRHLAVLPELIEHLDARGVDGRSNANFLAVVDVYRHYNDPSKAAIIEWPPGYCESGSADDVAAQTGFIRAGASRSTMLQVHPANWNADTIEWDTVCPSWGAWPTRVRLWYRAGYRGPGARGYQDMSPELERAVAYLALAMLDREWTTCEQLRNVMQHWRTDLARAEAGGERYRIAPGDLNNPFGTTRAAMYAWQVVKRLQIGEVVMGG